MVWQTLSLLCLQSLGTHCSQTATLLLLHESICDFLSKDLARPTNEQDRNTRDLTLLGNGQELVGRSPSFFIPLMKLWGVFYTVSLRTSGDLSPSCPQQSPSQNTPNIDFPFSVFLNPLLYHHFLGSPPKSATCTLIFVSGSTSGETQRQSNGVHVYVCAHLCV